MGYSRDYLLCAVIVQLNSNTESTLSLGRGLEAVFRCGGGGHQFLMSKGNVVFHHDNARSHTAAFTQKKMARLG